MTNKRKVYLSGPVRKVDDNGETWRNEIIDKYGDFIDFINPLDYFSPETHEIYNGQGKPQCPLKETVHPHEYVSKDKQSIEESDAVLVGISEDIARGTMMECMYAFTQDKPLYIWKIDGQEESGWLYHHANFMSSNMRKTVKAVRYSTQE